MIRRAPVTEEWPLIDRVESALSKSCDGCGDLFQRLQLDTVFDCPGCGRSFFVREGWAEVDNSVPGIEGYVIFSPCCDLDVVACL